VRIEANNNSVEISSISSQSVDFVLSNWICYSQNFDEGNSITIRQSRLENTRILPQSQCHSMAIRNSMITSRAGNLNDYAVIWSPYWDTTTTPQSFTVVGSTLRGGSLFIEIEEVGNPPQALVKLQNSVFENDGAEILINGGDVFAIRNRYDSLTIVNGSLAQNENNLNAAPQLQARRSPAPMRPAARNPLSLLSAVRARA